MGRFIVAVGLLLGVATNSIAKSFACDACTYEQREAAAIGQGAGVRYVHDLRFGEIHKFIVTREPGPSGGFVYFAYEDSVETDLADSFGKLKALFDANGGSLAINLGGEFGDQSAGSAGRSVSAYDAVDPGAYQNAVADYLAADWYSGLSSGMYQVIYGAIYALRIMDFANGPQLTFEVEFPDGSKMVFKFELVQKKWVYVKGSARDSNGNNIPEKAGLISFESRKERKDISLTGRTVTRIASEPWSDSSSWAYRWPVGGYGHAYRHRRPA